MTPTLYKLNLVFVVVAFIMVFGLNCFFFDPIKTREVQSGFANLSSVTPQ